jgi:GNAT superfamily N-acetyltransferase
MWHVAFKLCHPIRAPGRGCRPRDGLGVRLVRWGLPIFLLAAGATRKQGVGRSRAPAGGGEEMIAFDRPAGYEISADPALLDMDVIHGFLTDSYWSPGVPRQIVETAVDHSVCVGAYFGGAQVGFARVVTDYATFAYVADVFVIEGHRGHGVGKQLVAALQAHPDLQGLRTWLLLTRDAQGLYEQFGFECTGDPRRVMWIRNRDMYRQAGPSPVNSERSNGGR